eukprot:366440-Chlamydomonas_euryale.AAC.2
MFAAPMLTLQCLLPRRAPVVSQKCPFDAIMIINLPRDLEKETTHRYGPNTFKLHRCGAGCGLRVERGLGCESGAQNGRQRCRTRGGGRPEMAPSCISFFESTSQNFNAFALFPYLILKCEHAWTVAAACVVATEARIHAPMHA